MTSLSAKDRRRLEKLCTLADKLIDAMDDARRREIIGDWKGATSKSLRDDLVEFHDWQLRRLAP